MSENLVIYAGVRKAGEIKKRAIEREAKRRKMSLADFAWESFEKNGSEELKRELSEARRIEDDRR